MFIAAAVVVVLGMAGLAGYLVYRARRAAVQPGAAVQAHAVLTSEPLTGRPMTAGYGPRAALEQPATRELHLHFDGVDAEQVAEILRRH